MIDELRAQVELLRARNAELEAKLAPSEEVGIVELAVKRTTSLLFFIGCLSATAIILESWEQTLHKNLELTFFVPLMIGHGGNTGGSVVGATLSRMGRGESSVKTTLMVELGCAVVVGVVLAAAAAVLPGFGISQTTTTVVMLSLVAITLLGALLGALVPHALEAARLDAASLAPPAVTTVIDALGLVVYLLIADNVTTTTTRVLPDVVSQEL